MDRISPGIIESLDFLVIFFHASSNNQIFILNDSSISESDLVTFRIDLFHSYEVGLSDVLTDGLSGSKAEVKLSNAELMQYYQPCS